ncbi:MAG: hypothetical protein Ta2F_02930 [Termitinemataceae bacterium]|nr:MAG: hypothetical protein Ta2F_02930 [Termitinemataceae bacterium]
MGVPGESHALDIALRYGIRRDIIDAARVSLQQGHADISALISGLIEKRRAADEKQSELDEKERFIYEQQRKLSLKELQLRQKEAEIKEGSVGTLRALLTESRKTLENLVRELKESGSGEISRGQTLKVKEFLKSLEASVAAEDEKLTVFAAETKNLKENHYPAEEKPAGFIITDGLDVLVGEKKVPGTVRRAGKKGFWIIDIGSVSAPFAESDIYPAKNIASNHQKSSVQIKIDYAPNSQQPVLELKLLGMRAEQALEALQKQFDAAMLNGMTEFSVIHGKGDGILRTAVHNFLQNQKNVAEFGFSHPELGGTGRTEVKLKL